MAARAAAAAPPPKSFSHATDDGLPRITFRGDGAYFAVSSLDPHPPSGEDAKSPGSRRQVRVYARDASNGHVPKLSATSESLPGLEGALAWRPSGNVIASLVRYGYEGGGEGRKGRWDVAMLERNGLRHGGFELREAEKTWENGYVHDMAWNADSEVLAIWIRREKEDVGELVCCQEVANSLSSALDHEELPLLPQAGDHAGYRRLAVRQRQVAPGKCHEAVPRQR